MDSRFLHATLILILVTDPLGNIPLFITALERVSTARRTRVILRECAFAFGILLLAMVGGRGALGVLGIGDASLKAAGGVILLLIAINMIFPMAGARMGEGPTEGEPLIVPIAVPLIAGPSAIATAMLVAADDPTMMPMWIGALAISMALTLASLFLSSTFKRLLGVQFLSAIERLMGLVLTAVSVDMIMGGAGAYFGAMIK
ncbi:MAG TPA: MarC family protein [bacterium]|jgi:MarC family membrane protein|nr:MarC family protein [bacterium]